MRRAILFTFYKEFDVCKNHIELLRAFNPGIDIYGMYGGPELDGKDLSELKLDHIWTMPNKNGSWRWRNGDICVAEWYKSIGHTFDFDMLHVMDWDALLLAPVVDFFAHINSGIAVTGPITLAKVYDTWSWVSGDIGRAEWLKLLAHVKRVFNYNDSPLACMGCGLSVSRDFLVRYSEINPTELCCCEVRLPLYAQCFNMPVHSNRMRNPKYFETDEKNLTADIVLEAYKRGVRAFHPVHVQVPLAKGGMIYGPVNS